MNWVLKTLVIFFAFTGIVLACDFPVCVGDIVIMKDFENKTGDVLNVVPGEPEAQIFVRPHITSSTVVNATGGRVTIANDIYQTFAVRFQTTLSRVERVCEGGPCDRTLTAQQLKVLNEELLLPTDSSIVLSKDLVIPRAGTGCGTVSSDNGQIRCGVCRAQRSRDDISYSARTLIIEDNFLTKDGKELVFNIRHDPDGLQTVKCQSRDVFNIKTIQDVKALLLKHNLDLNIGGMIRK